MDRREKEKAIMERQAWRSWGGAGALVPGGVGFGLGAAVRWHIIRVTVAVVNGPGAAATCTARVYDWEG